jgi:hypothetical protein
MIGYWPKKSRFNVSFSKLSRDKSRLIIRFLNFGRSFRARIFVPWPLQQLLGG